MNSSIYISRLYINVSNKFINHRIYCSHDDGMNATLIGNLTIPKVDAIGKS